MKAFVAASTFALCGGHALHLKADDDVEHRLNDEVKNAGTGSPDPASNNESFEMVLTNLANTMYTFNASIGGQWITSIPDTGSFDLVVFSEDCQECAAPHAYQSSQSSSFSTTGFELNQYYGSGTATSLESHEDVSIGADKAVEVESQMFWKVTSADFGFWGVDFDSILGLGPPGSAVALDEVILKQMQDTLKDITAEGMDASSYRESVQSYVQAIEHAKVAHPFLRTSQSQRFSICLGPRNGEEGLMVWNDVQDWENTNIFTTVHNIDNIYWSAKIRDVRFSDGTKLGCNSEEDDVRQNCNVMVDSGTSLLVMPQQSYEWMRSAVVTLQKGSCDMSAMPALHFEMGGQAFVLPPEAYMGVLTGTHDPSESLIAHMPHVALEQTRPQSSESGGCSLMAMTSEEDDSPAWILGLPFFRQYYSTFVLDQQYSRPQQMHFAEKDDSCHPMAKSELKQTFPGKPLSAEKLISIDVRKIRLPRRSPQRRISELFAVKRSAMRKMP